MTLTPSHVRAIRRVEFGEWWIGQGFNQQSIITQTKMLLTEWLRWSRAGMTRRGNAFQVGGTSEGVSRQFDC